MEQKRDKTGELNRRNSLKHVYSELANLEKVEAWDEAGTFRDGEVHKLSLGVVAEFTNEFERACYFLSIVFSSRTKKRQLLLMTYCLSFLQRIDFLSISPGLIPLASIHSISQPEFEKLAARLEPVFQNLLEDVDQLLTKPPVHLSQIAGILLDYLTETRDPKIRGCLMSMFGWAFRKRMQKLNECLDLMFLQLENGGFSGQSQKFVQ